MKIQGPAQPDKWGEKRMIKRKKIKRIAALLIGCILAVSPSLADDRPIFGVIAQAAERTGSVNATNLNVRSGPGTSYQAVAKLSHGAPVTVIGEKAAADGTVWYQIRFSGQQTGYVSSQYVKFSSSVASDGDFENYMNVQGFPESYKPGLRELHAQYPNWTFTAFHTNLDWNTAVENESVIGRNLVSSTSISSWKSTAPGAYNWDSGTWPGFDGSSWVQASEDIIRYYMDPRNFLNDKYIFQFMKQSYNSSIHSREGLESMVSGTFLSGTASSAGAPASGNRSSGSSEGSGSGPASEISQGVGSPIASIQDHDVDRVMSINGPGSGGNGFETGNTVSPDGSSAPGGSLSPSGSENAGSAPASGSQSYVDIIMSAAAQSGVNPYILASMILQEQGSQGTGRSISGTVNGYQGYYNFFNIEAYQSGSMGAVERGLWWVSQSGSYGRPWNSVERSIVGGATYYGDNYVKKGQDTLYLKKFNVQGSNLYKHQYMTNVLAAAAEGLTLSKIAALKTTALEFSIPVYKNMPDTVCIKPTLDGSPNNKLSGLGVDGFTLTPTFSRDTESYDLIVDPSVENVTIVAAAIDSKASVSGTGSVNLQSGINEITVAVKAENGAVRNYVLHVVRQSGGPTYTAGTGGLVSGGSSSGPGGGSGPGSQVEILGPGGGSSGNSSSGSSSPSGNGSSGNSSSGGNGVVAPGTGVNGFGTQSGGQLVAPGTPAPEGNAQENSGSGSVTSVKKGDVNGDGKLNILDVLSVQRHILSLGSLSESGKLAADVNGNGKIDIMDVLLMQKDILGIQKLN